VVDYSITGHEGPGGGVRYSYTFSLTSALGEVGSQCHAPVALIPRKRSGTHCIGGPRAGLDGSGKTPPNGIRSPDHTARSESLYYAIPARELRGDHVERKK
jgi:hypothetical protein